MEIEVRLEKCQINPNSNLETELPTIHTETTSYENFFSDFLVKNQACLIKNVSTNWDCSRLWVEKNQPHFSYLDDAYGGSEVTIYDCNNKYYNSQKTHQSTLSEFLIYWKSYRNEGYPKQKPVYYLKDWHLKNKHPCDRFYEVPLYFTSDWLNEYLIANGMDDYRFVYMGPKGTWTPFHADVFSSFSWSVNVCGQKRWVLLPPGQEDCLRDPLGNLPYDLSDNLLADIKHFNITQNPGEAVFVPSGWYHQVWNMEDAISVNHNWFNGCNIMLVWHALKAELTKVKAEIRDCQDMDDFAEHCQVMLRSSYGMDFYQFCDLLSYIARTRIRLIDKGVPVELAQNRSLGKRHALYDLERIGEVVELFVQHEDMKDLLKVSGFVEQLKQLFLDIKVILQQCFLDER